MVHVEDVCVYVCVCVWGGGKWMCKVWYMEGGGKKGWGYRQPACRYLLFKKLPVVFCTVYITASVVFISL